MKEELSVRSFNLNLLKKKINRQDADTKNRFFIQLDLVTECTDLCRQHLSLLGLFKKARKESNKNQRQLPGLS